MKAKSGTPKVSPGLMNTRPLVLLMTTLLVVALVLMVAPGVSVAQTVVAFIMMAQRTPFSSRYSYMSGEAKAAVDIDGSRILVPNL